MSCGLEMYEFVEVGWWDWMWDRLMRKMLSCWCSVDVGGVYISHWSLSFVNGDGSCHRFLPLLLSALFHSVRSIFRGGQSDELFSPLSAKDSVQDSLRCGTSRV